MPISGKYQGIVKPITPHSSMHNRFYLEERNTKKTIFKYMPFSYFMSCLGFDKNGNRDISKQYIYFQEPSQWTDQYESRFYNADYQSILHIDNQKTPKLYACCFSNEKNSAAAWKIYEGIGTLNFCIQLEIGRKDLLVELCKNQDFDFYEGLIDYSLSDIQINQLHLNNGKSKFRKFYNGIFELENYLSLLLIKRKAFDFEKEFRIFMIPKNHGMVIPKFIKVPINWDNCIKKIKIERVFSNQEKFLIQKINNCLTQMQIEPSDINEMREKNIVFGAAK